MAADRGQEDMDMDMDMDVVGLLLAAGAGRRMGRPKALVGSWLVDAAKALQDGGCRRVLVVLGASAQEAARLLDGIDVELVVADDWNQGIGASLRTGLAALSNAQEAAVLVTLVDLPDVGAGVVRRLVDRPLTPATLARASYSRSPGHPVLLGRDHWHALADTASGDTGARTYLAANGVELVECGDLARGQDVDTPASGQPLSD
jgi:molybdenum cofactor cytidylyltransferase/nicotine blue oxidoreductase